MLKILFFTLLTIPLLNACGSGGDSPADTALPATANTVSAINGVTFEAQISGLITGESLEVVFSQGQDELTRKPITQSNKVGKIELTTLTGGEYKITLEGMPAGIACELTLSEEQLNPTLLISCNDDAVKHLSVDISLGDNASLAGITASIEGLVTGDILIDAPHINLTITGPSLVFNGKIETESTPDLKQFTIENQRLAFNAVDIATDIRTISNPTSTFYSDSAGTINISYDSRLLGSGESENIPLLLVTFDCPTTTTLSSITTSDEQPICKLSHPIRVLLTPAQFRSGQWGGHVVTEAIVRKLRYYLLAD